jgi:hypothetical protein
VSGRRGRVALERAPSAPTGESRINDVVTTRLAKEEIPKNKTMSDEEEIILRARPFLSSQKGLSRRVRIKARAPRRV